MHPALDTPRLLLRPVQLSDAPDIQALFPHWEIVRYFPKTIPWPYPADGAAQYLRSRLLPEVEKGTRHSWAITLRSDPAARLIGVIELNFATPYSQRNFWLGRSWHGLGLMTEATFALNDYALPGLGMPDLLFTSADANHASNRVKEVSGAVPIEHGEYEFHAGRLPITRWQLTARAWARHRKQVWASLRRWNPADFTQANQTVKP